MDLADGQYAHGMSAGSGLRTVAATRYVTPFREGGSLPGLLEASDDGLYVVKFRGAGQGRRALVAEVIGGELARALGLPVPEQVIVTVDPALGVAEPDPEIQDLIVASPGANLGVDFLPGAVTYAPGADWSPDPALAAEIVWLDALLTNVDRTPRNPNLLVWHERLWLIDHGAALYLQHAGPLTAEQATRPFAHIREHVLLERAGPIAEADERLMARIDPSLVAAVVALVPADWLGDDGVEAYVEYLTRRLESPRLFVTEAEDARVNR
jgi:hypothetical protein